MIINQNDNTVHTSRKYKPHKTEHCFNPSRYLKMINEFLLQLMNILWISEQDVDKELEKEIPDKVIKEIDEEKSEEDIEM